MVASSRQHNGQGVITFPEKKIAELHFRDDGRVGSVFEDSHEIRLELEVNCEPAKELFCRIQEQLDLTQYIILDSTGNEIQLLGPLSLKEKIAALSSYIDYLSKHELSVVLSPPSES